jgi:hypothetical protein
LSVTLTHHLWITWTEIAVAHERTAWEARIAGAATDDPGKNLTSEFHPSLIGVAAASHALDGFYGEIRELVTIPEQTREGWKSNNTPRHARILAVLSHGFRIGKMQHEWRPEFEWLFDARNAALHHLPKPSEGDPHPMVPGFTSGEVAFYRAEACSRAVDLLADVLRKCVASAELSTKAWASGAAHAVEAKLDERVPSDVRK